MTAENNNTFNHSRFVILLRRKFTKSQTSPISPTPIEIAASSKEGGPDGTGPRVHFGQPSAGFFLDRDFFTKVLAGCVKVILPSAVWS